MFETRTLSITTQVACKKKHPKPPQYPKSKNPKKKRFWCNLFNNICVVGKVWSPQINLYINNKSYITTIEINPNNAKNIKKNLEFESIVLKGKNKKL